MHNAISSSHARCLGYQTVIEDLPEAHGKGILKMVRTNTGIMDLIGNETKDGIYVATIHHNQEYGE